MDEDEEFDPQPERATPLRYGLALLVFVTESAQAFANLWGMVTMVTTQHLMQKKIDSEFGKVVKCYDHPGIGSGSPESQD